MHHARSPVRFELTQDEARELYEALTDERPPLMRALRPREVSPNTVVKLHVALRDQQVRNLL